MKVFNYKKQWMSPTDRHVLPIYKEYLKLSNEVLEAWKRGVVTGLMGHREYVDIADSRLTYHATSKKGGSFVISMTPVIGFDNEAHLKKYTDFFQLYDTYHRMLIFYVASVIDLKYLEKDHSNFDIALMSNVLKLLISAWNSGVFDPEDFNYPASHFYGLVFAERMRALDLGHIVGPNFKNESGTISAECDSELIGSFYRYVRKLSASYPSESYDSDSATSR